MQRHKPRNQLKKGKSIIETTLPDFNEDEKTSHRLFNFYVVFHFCVYYHRLPLYSLASVFFFTFSAWLAVCLPLLVYYWIV